MSLRRQRENAMCRGLQAALLGLATLGVAAGPAGDAKDVAVRKEQILRRFLDEFVLLTPGADKFPATFAMGSAGDAPASEKPVRVITLKQPFALAKYEVTQE